MANCNTCALQYKDACPHQFDKASSCSKYVERHFDPHPPRRGGRYKPEPGEYPRGQRTPPFPTTGSPKRHATGSPKRPVSVKHVPKVSEGQPLYYRDKNTGIINCGVIAVALKDGFYYAFDGRTVFLGYDVIGSRLFFSWNEAWQHYKKEKNSS